MQFSSSSRPLVAVLLGTDHHPFDRLVQWVSLLDRSGEWEWFVQHGHTPLPPTLHGRPLLRAGDLSRLLDEASAVVTHGGPGLIMDARAAHHVPIVVPRDPAFGEHVDGHQLAFARHLAATDGVRTVDSAPALEATVAAAVRARRTAVEDHGTRETDQDQTQRTVERFGQLVAGLRERGASA